MKCFINRHSFKKTGKNVIGKRMEWWVSCKNCHMNVLLINVNEKDVRFSPKFLRYEIRSLETIDSY
jgi:hypothetical protein